MPPARYESADSPLLGHPPHIVGVTLSDRSAVRTHKHWTVMS